MMDRNIRHVATPFGDIAYTEQGTGLPALFVHGAFLNGYHWRNVIAQAADMRRCIAIDLLGHGETQTTDKQNISFSAQAEMLLAFCDALGLAKIDLVANDSGGGIAQIFAARHAERLRSLTLTNCDTHDNWPPNLPTTLKPLFDTIAEGRFGEFGHAMLSNLDFARQTLAIGYEHPERLSDETLRIYLEPLFSTPERTELLAQFFVQMDCSQTVRIEPILRTLKTPTLIVWGKGDIFFDVKWAYWLRDTIPGVREMVTLDGAHLFFPEERPNELVAPLRAHWQVTGGAE